MTDQDRTDILKAAARSGDGPLDLVETAMALARWRSHGVDLSWYRDHIAALIADVDQRVGTSPTVEEAAEALSQTMAQTFGYVGNSDNYDDLQNADLIRVMDRRKGLPVALGILYIAVARGAGWKADGLAFPGHFLIGLQVTGERLILDPFHGGVCRGPADLRALIKALYGPEGELRPTHYAPVSDIRILLRLADNMRVRLAEGGRTREALSVVDDMLLMAPESPWLMRERAILQINNGQITGAIETLTNLLASPQLDQQARHDAASLLEKVRTQLH